MYTGGTGVAKDFVEASKWFHLAADQGDGSAQYALALMYQIGDGILQDNVIANMWFNLASANGEADAGQARDNIAAYMTAADLSEAQIRARVCLASNYQDCDRLEPR